MQTKTKMTTKSGKTVWVRVASVGMAFGCCAVITHRNGREIASTRVVPYGMSAAALDDAREWCAAH